MSYTAEIKIGRRVSITRNATKKCFTLWLLFVAPQKLRTKMKKRKLSIF